MTNSDTAIREFAEKYMVGTPYTLMYKDGNPYYTIVENNFLSDLTALISEHYVSREEFEEQKRIYFRLFDEEISCMYCEAKIRRGSAIVLCKECAESYE